MELLDIIKEAKNIVAFTGAGLSTESGIPDFRSSSGIYLSGEFEGYTPERILSNRFFRDNKKVFFDFYKKRILSMADKQPNRAHYALQKLESVGKLKCVVNQNIDNLLQKAGVKNVLDLHGNGSQFRCLSACGKGYYTCEEFMKMDDDIPRCECGGIVRPNTVLFDEWLSDDTFDAAYCAAKDCDLFIVIGSSLLVKPAATLVGEITDECKLVIINNMSTPYDKKAYLIISKPCGEVLEETINKL